MSNPFDAGGMGNLLGMLGGLQGRMEEMKKRSAATVVEGEAGGVVKVRMTCDFHVVSVKIDPKAAGDAEMLEDLVKVAVDNAHQKVRDELAGQMKQMTGGLPLPPGLFGF